MVAEPMYGDPKQYLLNTRAVTFTYLNTLHNITNYLYGEGTAGVTGDLLDDSTAALTIPCPLCKEMGAQGTLNLTLKDRGGLTVSCGLCTPGGKGIRRLRDACRLVGIQLNKSKAASPTPSGGEGEAGDEEEDGDPSQARLPFFDMGEWFGAQYFTETLRYVRNENGTACWGYEDNRWQTLDRDYNPGRVYLAKNGLGVTKDMKEAGHKLWARLGSSEKHYRVIKAKESDFWIGFQEVLRQTEEPESPLHLIGTPDGVANLITGVLLPHSPEHGIRAITKARYRPEDLKQPKLLKVMEDAFYQRFHRVLSPENQLLFLELLGLALTRTAPNHRGWVAVLGGSGSGKGGLIDVIQQALGPYCLSLPRRWIQGKSGGDDIDTVAADLIQVKPAVLTADESALIGVDPGVLFSLTGATMYSGRRPQQPARLYGPALGQFWTTSITPPTAPRNEGAERRIAVLPTLDMNLEASGAIDSRIDPDCLDYVLTLAIQAAATVYQPGYVATGGDPEARQEALRQMDGLAEWLDDLPDTWHGQTTKAAWEHFVENTGSKITSNSFGKKVSSHPRWGTHRARGRSEMRLLDAGFL